MLEKILAVLTALIAAIEANTAAQLGKAKAPKASKEEKIAETPAAENPLTPAPEKEKTPEGPTVESLLALAQTILDRGGLEKVKAINAKFGIKKVRECPPEKFKEIEAALQKTIEELDAA